jgi:hypothetical protein
MNKMMKPVLIAFAPLALAACESMAPVTAPDVPAAVVVPAGNKPVMVLTGAGLLTYECRPKAGAAGEFEWAFVGPDATLTDKTGNRMGKYYGGPTWEHGDGSKVTGKQLAVSPGATGSIPLQLVQVNPGATGQGKFTNVTYIQRVNTVGGVAPKDPCNAGAASSKKTVPYSADYVFYTKQ